MDYLFPDLCTQFGFSPVLSPKPTVLIYGSEEAYRKKFNDGSGGHCQPRVTTIARSSSSYSSTNTNPIPKTTSTLTTHAQYTIFTFARSGKEQTFAKFDHGTLIHEASHALLSAVLERADLPPWFDEGVATYYGHWDLRVRPNFNIAYRSTRTPYQKHFSDHCRENGSAEISLAELLSVRTWNPDKMGTEAIHHYATAESFINFLMSNKEYYPLFEKVWTALLRREPLNQIFTDDMMHAVEPAWHKHLDLVAK
jgi:hypothetical protein